VTAASLVAPANHERPGDRHWVPLLLIFTTLIATSVFGARPMVSYVALSLGAGPTEIGLIASSFAILAIVGAIPLGRLIDRIGERPIMIAGGVICSLTCLALPFLGSIALLAAAQAALGVGQMCAVVGSHTLLANRGPESKRASRIGWYTSSASLGHALGPGAAGAIIGQELTREASLIALLAAAGVAAVAAVVAVGIRNEPRAVTAHRRAQATTGTVLGTLRAPGMIPALTAGVIALTAVDLLVAYLPAYGEERRIAPSTIGFGLAVLALAQMVSRLGLGRLLDRFSHASIVIASVAIAGVVIPLLTFPLGEPALIAIMAIAGLGLGLAQPLTLVWVAIATPAANRGLAMGVRMSGNRLGQLVVPVAVGVTAGPFGVSAIFVTVAAMLAGAAGYVFRERGSLAPIPSPIPSEAIAPSAVIPDP
jgi:MFS family permease